MSVMVGGMALVLVMWFVAKVAYSLGRANVEEAIDPGPWVYVRWEGNPHQCGAASLATESRCIYMRNHPDRNHRSVQETYGVQGGHRERSS